MLITDAAVRETATALAHSLGEDWTLDPQAPADGAAHLIYSDGRAVSFRPIFGGATVQLWITGNAAPALPRNATPAERAAHEAHTIARLAEGHRYNKATTLVTEEDEEPATVIFRTLQDLLPAFEHKPRYVGHQPWIDLFDSALAAVTAERNPSPAANADAVRPATEAESEPQNPPAPDPEPSTEAAREDNPEPVPDAKTQPQRPHADDASGEPGEQGTPPASRGPRRRAPKRRPKPNAN
ncbi:hypothetical protein [Streptomyces triticiradicis]|uniref:YbjN domain-containing protein n=1 Tax=Streptomyces triticiradicis TaxID=2651189 RepID=A0A7J5DM95_9ACTN|nr:hypothetical protein [Streptomyces triticiradicis]KAB1989834.1 hypothetical protein F8144_05670 [Streptomyces triticiradicis]